MLVGEWFDLPVIPMLPPQKTQANRAAEGFQDLEVLKVQRRKRLCRPSDIPCLDILEVQQVSPSLEVT